MNRIKVQTKLKHEREHWHIPLLYRALVKTVSVLVSRCSFIVACDALAASLFPHNFKYLKTQVF
jgi:hypothetical protein